jgi:hypothetical protein
MSSADYIIDTRGRVWIGNSELIQYSRCFCEFYCNCGSNPFSICRRLIHEGYRLAEEFPLLSSMNGIVRFLNINDKLRDSSTKSIDDLDHPNKVLTTRGEIFSLTSNKIVDNSRIYTRLVEILDGCYKLDIQGNLYFEDELIAQDVQYLGYIGKSGIVIYKDDNWQYRLHPSMKFRDVEGVQPKGFVLSQRCRLIRTDLGLYRLTIKQSSRVSCSKIELQGLNIRDAIQVRDTLYLLTKDRRIAKIDGGDLTFVEPELIEIINNSDPICNLYLEDSQCVFSTKSGKLFQFDDGIRIIKKYDEEIFKKMEKPVKSSRKLNN